MDRVDLLILAMLVLAIIRGINLGFLRLLFSSIGFVVGLFVGSFAVLKFFQTFSVQGSLAKIFIILIGETFFGICFSLLLELVAIDLTKKEQGLRLSSINQFLGAFFEIVSLLVLIWLVAPSLLNVQTDRLGYFVRRSAIIDTIDGALPVPPSFIARLESIVSPNSFPNVFVGQEPQHTTIEPNSTVDNATVTQDEQSVVKVEGQGCGGTVEGSGFVVSNDIVVTNAHVIAGIKSPQVIDGAGTYSATPIWFDPNLDLAVLRVDNLELSSLTMSTNTLADGTGVVALGFPNDGPLVSVGGAVIDEVKAEGQNIYNQGLVDRNIYEIQANIEPGNSGGPLITSNGTVAGIVFAKSVSQNSIGYVLLSSDVQPSIQKAISLNQATGDGSCTSS